MRSSAAAAGSSWSAVMLSGISSRDPVSRSGRAGRPPAAPAERVCRPRGPPAGRDGRSPVRLLKRPPVRGAASGREPAPRGPGRSLAARRAGAPPAALRAGRRPGLSLPRPAGERPLVDAPGSLAASGRRDRPGARAPVVPPRAPVLPPRVRSPAGRPGRAADRVPRPVPGDSPPDDPYRRVAPPVLLRPVPAGWLTPRVPLRPPAVLRAVPPDPLWPAPVLRLAPLAPFGPAAGLRLAPPGPLVPFRVAPVFRPAPPVPARVARVARDGTWPAAREPVRRVPPPRSGLPVARSRPCSPVTLSSAPTTQLPGQHS